jgi:uncharacterized protein (TIGR00288 family)
MNFLAMPNGPGVVAYSLTCIRAPDAASVTPSIAGARNILVWNETGVPQIRNCPDGHGACCGFDAFCKIGNHAILRRRSNGTHGPMDNEDRPGSISDRRIALLIDADNVSHGKIAAILAELSKYGTANIRRAYGDWANTRLKGWKDKLHKLAIRPIQQFNYSVVKNATDIALVIDAIELLYTQKPDAFCLVSSDADFTPLVMQLKARGHEVYGFGECKTPAPFVNALHDLSLSRQFSISTVWTIRHEPSLQLEQPQKPTLSRRQQARQKPPAKPGRPASPWHRTPRK